MPHTLKRIGVGAVAAAIIAAGAAGCGGGGGGGGGTGATNSAPVFGALAFSTKQGTDLSGQVTATDAGNDALTFTRVDDPANGSVTSFTAAGAFVYHPTSATFTGTDSFHVRVTDTGGNTTNGTVAITVRPNQPPVSVTRT